MFWAIYLVDLLKKTRLSNLNADLSDKEKPVVFHLAGCAFSTFSRKLMLT